MGTNYYLEPRGYEDLDKLNKATDLVIKGIEVTYKEEVQKMIDESDKICDIYSKVLDRADPDNIHVKLEWAFEGPDVHVCKISAGWIPLFEKRTDCYSTFKEFETFYNNHKKYFTLVDEYGNKIDFNKFKADVFNRVSDKSSETHMQYNSYYGSDHQYYKDEDGVEWIDTQFS